MFVKSLRSSTRIVRNCRQYTNWPFLKEEHVMVAETCRNFANDVLAPQAAQVDRDHMFPTESIKQLGEMGMMSVFIPEEYGGSGMDYVSYAIAMEEISRGCASAGVIMSAHNSLYSAPVEKYGTHEQKVSLLHLYGVLPTWQ
jgi:butyryl-CoA dehydrogenase